MSRRVKKVTIEIPHRISGFFEIVDKLKGTDIEDPLRIGSRGAGFCLNAKGKTEIKDFVLNKEDLEFRIKSIEGAFKGGRIFLDVSEDESIVFERLFRELIRNVQELRKKKKLKVSQKIVLKISTDENSEKKVEKLEKELKGEVGARKIEYKVKKPQGESKYKNFPVPKKCMEQVRKEGNELYVYNWSEWWPNELFQNFTKEFGVKIKY